MVTVPQLQNNENEKQGKKTIMNQLPKEFFNAPNEKEHEWNQSSKKEKQTVFRSFYNWFPLY